MLISPKYSLTELSNSFLKGEHLLYSSVCSEQSTSATMNVQLCIRIATCHMA